MITDKKICEDDIRSLYELLVSVSSVEDCRALMEDLCTVKEIEQMSQRVKAAKLLLEGKTYTQVMEQTEISSATLSRVSRCVQYGSGYTRFLKKENRRRRSAFPVMSEFAHTAVYSYRQFIIFKKRVRTVGSYPLLSDMLSRVFRLLARFGNECRVV